ncbi:hypothetical protein V7166_19320 [Bacillus thuringiensis]
MGRYFDFDQREHRGPKKDISAGLTPEVVRKMNEQGLNDSKAEEIASELDTTIDEVKMALLYQPGALSLNKVMNDSGEDKDITLEKTLVDKHTERMEEDIENRMVLDSFVNMLEHKEFFVWDMHSNNRIQQSIADRVGVGSTGWTDIKMDPVQGLA